MNYSPTQTTQKFHSDEDETNFANDKALQQHNNQPRDDEPNKNYKTGNEASVGLSRSNTKMSLSQD